MRWNRKVYLIIPYQITLLRISGSLWEIVEIRSVLICICATLSFFVAEVGTDWNSVTNLAGSKRDKKRLRMFFGLKIRSVCFEVSMTLCIVIWVNWWMFSKGKGIIEFFSLWDTQLTIPINFSIFRNVEDISRIFDVKILLTLNVIFWTCFYWKNSRVTDLVFCKTYFSCDLGTDGTLREISTIEKYLFVTFQSFEKYHIQCANKKKNRIQPKQNSNFEL